MWVWEKAQRDNLRLLLLIWTNSLLFRGYSGVLVLRESIIFREKLKSKSKIRKNKYRKVIISEASEVCKKVGMTKLRKQREMNRCMLTKCEGMRDKTRVIIPSERAS